MQILGTQTGIPTVASITAAPHVARVLEGDLSSLKLGDLAQGTILRSTASETVVSLKGQRVVLPGMAGFAAGEEVAIRLVPRGDVKFLEISRPQSQQAPQLNLGQEMTGKIVESLGDGKYVLNVAGRAVVATGPDGLTPGMTLPLKVQQVVPQMVFQILSDVTVSERMTAHLIVENLPQRKPMGTTLNTLLDALTQFLGKAGAKPPPPSASQLSNLLNALYSDGNLDAAKLQELITQGGLKYEARLKQALGHPRELTNVARTDVKSALLSLLANLSKADQTSPLAQSAREHLQQIELQQLLNFLTMVEGDQFQLQLPLIPGSSETAFMSIEPDDSEDTTDGEPGEPGHRVRFAVATESGAVHVDLRVNPARLRLRVFAESDDVVKSLQHYESDLRAALQDGEHAIDIRVLPLGEMNTEDHGHFRAVSEGIPESYHLINVEG
ncbi:MAG: hypothetical protein O3A00_07325 [Planctomycetota bacterium]|nr:hypothetical protein [Planctomycetota bacterium]